MKRPKTPSRRPSPTKKYAVIKVKIPAPTRKQLDELKKLFKAKTVSTLGVSPTVAVTRQGTAMKRRRK